MNRRKAVTLTLAILALTAFVLPTAALARSAYYTGVGSIGVEEFGSYVNQANLAAGTIGGNPLLIEGFSELPPADIAITPDGVTAYPTGRFDELMGVDVATENEATPVSMSGEPWGIAIAPNGLRAYTANRFEDSVSVLDLATHEEVATIPLTGAAFGIAVTPDGTRAYVSTVNGEEEVEVIDLTTGTVIESIEVGEEPEGIAVTPDGKHVYVVNAGDQTVSEIDVATNTVVATIPTGAPGGEETQIAIAPNGQHAYTIGTTTGGSPEAWVVPIDLATGTAGTPVTAPGLFRDIAILPDGSHAYITYEEELPQVAALAVGSGLIGEGFGQGIIPFNLATNTLEPGFESLENPEALAIVPNQGPRAAIAGPATAAPGDALSFDGSGSSDSDGTVARYDWSFGDGTGAANAGPAVSHAYASPGTYQVTLTTTDNEGCSTEEVFTGQTAYCNGSAVARATHQVVVAGAAPKPKTLARCKQVSGKATSFTPRIRPGHVVPGVRVRLAVPTPSRLDVKAKLLWSVAGHQGSAQLESLSVNVKHWRRLRFPIPNQLSGLLPLGTAVTLELTIKTTPHNGAACAATVVQKTLHVHVVKVFPNAVQSKRPR